MRQRCENLNKNDILFKDTHKLQQNVFFWSRNYKTLLWQFEFKE